MYAMAYYLTIPHDKGIAMSRPLRIFLLAVAWVSCALGFIGIVVPVLPTTPFLLLATFLFAKVSPRAHTWITSTKTYKRYVEAFKSAGGMPIGTKVRVLAISFALMGLSACLVQKLPVWILLGCCAAFMLYLILVRIPTIAPERVQAVRKLEFERAE